MISTFRKRSLGTAVIRIIVSLCICVGSLYLSNLGILELIKGPQPLSFDQDLEQCVGKYVTFDAKYILGGFVEETSTNRKTRITISTAYAYIAMDSDTGTFIAIKVPKSKGDKCDALSDEFYEVFSGNKEDVSDSIKITGTLKKMDSTYRNYYHSSLRDLGVEDVNDYYSLYIDDGTAGGEKYHMLYIYTAVSVGALLYALYVLLKMLRKGYLKKINQYLEDHHTVSLETLESDFSRATLITKNIWVGKRWTFFISGMNSNLVSNEDLVWAYYYQKTGKHPESKVITFDSNKTRIDIDAKKSHANQLLEYWSKNCPQTVIGYDDELENLFEQNFTSFLDIKYNKEKAKYDGTFDGFNSTFATEDI